MSLESLNNDDSQANENGTKVIGLGCVRLENLDLDFKIRISDLQSNAKFENGFQRWDICFWTFIFTVRLGNPKKDLKTVLKNCGLARGRILSKKKATVPFSDFPIER